MASKPNCDRYYRCGICGVWDEPDFMTSTPLGDICNTCLAEHGAALADAIQLAGDPETCEK